MTVQIWKTSRDWTNNNWCP